MTNQRRTWVVVADGARVRILVLNSDGTGLVPAPSAHPVMSEVHSFARELKSDKPGRGFSSASGGPHHAIEPRHDYHKLEKHKFSAEVAKILHDGCAKGEFDRLILIAPHRSLGELRSLLVPQVQACIAKEIAKDLTKLPPAKLWAIVSPLIKKTPIHAVDE